MYSVLEYISRYGHYLDARWLGAICIVNDQPLIYDRRFDKYRDNEVGDCIKRWFHCVGRGGSLSRGVHESTGSPFVLWYKELNVDY